MALPWRRIEPVAPITARTLGCGNAAAIRAASIVEEWQIIDDFLRRRVG